MLVSYNEIDQFTSVSNLRVLVLTVIFVKLRRSTNRMLFHFRKLILTKRVW